MELRGCARSLLRTPKAMYLKVCPRVAVLRRVQISPICTVSAGTGRNAEFYTNSQIKSLRAVDLSPEMVKICRHKLGTPKFPAQCEVGDGQNLRGMADRSFDTVVDTFGLC